ncbi:MAG: CoA transferase [Rhodococcus fascians]
MYDVLKGVRVVEVAEWIFVPAAASILADWGADVVKIEHPRRGDAVRALSPVNFEVSNRGKRSVGLDISQPRGREILEDLIRDADVFMTNFMGGARRRLGIESSDLLEKYPQLIYARGTGHGIRGPAADKGGFDWAATWCRSGIAHKLTQPGQRPPGMPGSVGDLTGAIALAGAVSAALFRRERTGQGAVVDHSLYAAGAWMMSQEILRTSIETREPELQIGGINPLIQTYRTSDGRWIALCFLQGDRWWPDLCRHLERPDLADDVRFAEQDARLAHGRECTDLLETIFATKTFAEWMTILDTLEGVWAPVQSAIEVAADPQALINGIVTEVAGPDGGGHFAAASPGQFDERLIGELSTSPEAWQNTEEVLLELGLDWSDIAELQASGVVP